jgi:hypothetical protein
VGAEVFGLSVAEAGPTALLTLVVLLVLTGRLVPRSTLTDMRDERDMWRAAHTTSEAARQKALDQTEELLETARLGNQLLNSLPRPPRGEVAPDARVDQASGPSR